MIEKLLKSKRKIKFTKKINFIINVSRFSKRKDHETTLRALQKFQVDSKILN